MLPLVLLSALCLFHMNHRLHTQLCLTTFFLLECGEGILRNRPKSFAFAVIGFRRESCSNDRPRSDARPREDVRPCTTVTHRNFVVSKIRMTDLPVLNPWSRIFSAPLTGLSTFPGHSVLQLRMRVVHYRVLVMMDCWMNAGQLSDVSSKSHYCHPLLNWTALPQLLHYLSSRPYLTTIPCLLATLHAQPRWIPLL
jgi:hypothetical protein